MSIMSVDSKRNIFSTPIEKPKLIDLFPENQGTKTQSDLVHRYTLELFPSDDASFPEFDYSVLIKSIKGSSTPSTDPFDEDPTLKALAKKLEQKYGSASQNGKKKATKHLDTFDIGYGYDESDSFLDNSEAYDEVVPSDWTTEHGGFYINQGNLDFKPLSQSPNEKILQKVISSAKKKKRIIPKELNTDKKKRQFLNKEKQRKKQEALNKAQKILLKKKNKKNKSSTIDETSQDGILNKSLEDDLPLSKIKESSNVFTEKNIAPDVDKKQDDLTSSLSQTKFPSCTEPKDKSPVKTFGNNSIVAITSSPLSSKQKADNEGLKNSTVKIESPLPSGLSDDLLVFVKQLNSFASTYNKGKFFTPEVNQVLLKFARECRALTPRLRNGVYDHILFYLPCAKDTLVKRCRALIVQHQQDLEDEPLKLLKQAIEKSMLEQKKIYDDKVAEALQEQAREQIKQTGLDPIKANENQDGLDEKAKKNFPKKKFVWHDEMRKLLCDVVQVRVGLFKLSKSKSMTAEEYIKDFLESEIRKLWPKGWMTSRILYKECRATHITITQPLKTKKLKTDTCDSKDSLQTSGSSITLPDNNLVSITLNGTHHSTCTLSDSRAKTPVSHVKISKAGNSPTSLSVSSAIHNIVSVTSEYKCSSSSALSLINSPLSESKLNLNSKSSSPGSISKPPTLIKQYVHSQLASHVNDIPQAVLSKSQYIISTVERSATTSNPQPNLLTLNSSQNSQINVLKQNLSYAHVPEHGYSNPLSFNPNFNRLDAVHLKKSKMLLAAPVSNLHQSTTQNHVSCMPTMGKEISSNLQSTYAQNDLRLKQIKRKKNNSFEHSKRAAMGSFTVSNSVSDSWQKVDSGLARLSRDAAFHNSKQNSNDSVISCKPSDHSWVHTNKFGINSVTMSAYPRHVDTIVISDDEHNLMVSSTQLKSNPDLRIKSAANNKQNSVLSNELYNMQSKNNIDRIPHSYLQSQYLVKTPLIATSQAPSIHLIENSSTHRSVSTQRTVDQNSIKSTDVLNKNNGANAVSQHVTSMEFSRVLQKNQESHNVILSTSPNRLFQQHNSDHLLHYPLKFNTPPTHHAAEPSTIKSSNLFNKYIDNHQSAMLLTSQIQNPQQEPQIALSVNEEVEMIRKEFLGASTGNTSFDSRYR